MSEPGKSYADGCFSSCPLRYRASTPSRGKRGPQLQLSLWLLPQFPPSHHVCLLLLLRWQMMMQGVSESLGLHGGHHQNPSHHHLLSPSAHSTHVLACAGGERAKKEVDNERHIPEVDVETNQIPLRCWQDPMPPLSVTQTPVFE